MAARKAGQGSKWIRPTTRLAIYMRDGHRCAYCGHDLTGGGATLDHVLACELGGANAPANLVTCCQRCNSRKQDLSIREWFRRLRAEGIDTDKIGRRIRRLTKKDMGPYRVAARAIIGK